jgi:hypothetical protein
MNDEHLPEFAGAYLEDSYFLGIVAEGANLRLKLLLALTTDHHAYAPPKSGEIHCYREGSLVLEQPSIVEWRAGKPALTHDPDGTFDLGHVELHQCSSSRFRLVTEWFEAVVEVTDLRIEVSDANV